MYNVVVFGTGKTSAMVESGLSVKVNIVCYCDNDKSKWGKIYNERKIHNPKELKKINFDYIVIASQYNEEIYNQLLDLDVDKKKILQFYKYLDSYYNYIEINLSVMLEKKEEIEVIATGISYMEKAIDNEMLSKKISNLAKHSQDLYFDYHLFKYIINNYSKNLYKLRYAFIGLAYYSFEYDMSLSAMKGKVPLYYEAIGVSHNMSNIDDFIYVKEINSEIASNIFNFNSKSIADPSIHWNDRDVNVVKINEEIGKKQALLDGKKNYPLTLKENVQIFIDYLSLLKENYIKPIVIVCPVTKYYSEYFPKRLKDEFLMIIEEIKNEHDFQFIDYFDSDKFDDNDFYDVSHLNENGATKFTKILNQIVEW